LDTSALYKFKIRGVECCRQGKLLEGTRHEKSGFRAAEVFTWASPVQSRKNLFD